jgi:hypothetical protein
MRIRRRPPLRVEPVRAYPRPAYPTIDVYAEHPEALLRHAPPRWLEGGAALGALTAFVLAGSSGRADAQSASGPSARAADDADTTGRVAPTCPAPEQERYSVAPVFIHGEGRGATGCVVVSPPVFLSEAEALEIIWEELRAEDLGFVPQTLPVPGFSMRRPVEPMNYPPEVVKRFPQLAARSSEPRQSPVFFDAYSARYRCGVVFVGMVNYSEVDETPLTGVISTASDYDMVARAQGLVERLSEYGKVNAGVFYDPLPHWDGRRDAAQGQARELLREQVLEFVEWLKGTLKEHAADPRPAAEER